MVKPIRDPSYSRSLFSTSSTENGTRSSVWPAKDGELLVDARARGLNWNQIALKFFPLRSPNALRERHEYLVGRRERSRMATTLSNTDTTYLQELKQAKEEFWSRNSHLSQNQRQELLFQAATSNAFDVSSRQSPDGVPWTKGESRGSHELKQLDGAFRDSPLTSGEIMNGTELRMGSAGRVDFDAEDMQIDTGNQQQRPQTGHDLPFELSNTLNQADTIMGLGPTHARFISRQPHNQVLDFEGLRKSMPSRADGSIHLQPRPSHPKISQNSTVINRSIETHPATPPFKDYPSKRPRRSTRAYTTSEQLIASAPEQSGQSRPTISLGNLHSKPSQAHTSNESATLYINHTISQDHTTETTSRKTTLFAAIQDRCKLYPTKSNVASRLRKRKNLH